MEKQEQGEDSPNSRVHTEESLGAEYSYLDFLIEKKFYKRFSLWLKLLLSVFTVIFTASAYFGVSTYLDLREKLQEAEQANSKIQAVYTSYLQQDSVKALREENSRYYCYYLETGKPAMREAIGNRMREAGFAIADAGIEDAVSSFLNIDSNWVGNAAAQFVTKSKGASQQHYIGVLYNGVSEPIRNRVDSILRDVYPSAIIQFFEDPHMPGRGFFYSIE